MIYLAVNRNNEELLFDSKPKYDRILDSWYTTSDNIYYKHFDNSEGIDGMFNTPIYRKYINCGVKLPTGSIFKLINKHLTFKDEPFCLENVT